MLPWNAFDYLQSHSLNHFFTDACRKCEYRQPKSPCDLRLMKRLKSFNNTEREFSEKTFQCRLVRIKLRNDVEPYNFFYGKENTSTNGKKGRSRVGSRAKEQNKNNYCANWLMWSSGNLSWRNMLNQEFERISEAQKRSSYDWKSLHNL